MFDFIKNKLDPPEKNQRIFYLHIPKCAGTSVNHSIMSLYKPWRAGNENKVFYLEDPAARVAEDILENDQKSIRKSISAYAMSCKNVRLVIGHFAYSKNVFNYFADTWSFVTMLRHPVDRWISHYYYNLNRPHKYEINEHIDEFVHTERAKHLGALTVNMFSELQVNSSNRNVAINKAIENLKKFSLVGCLEKMQSFESQFYSLFGKKLKVPRRNLGSKRRMSFNINNMTWNKIWDICHPDIQLFKEFFRDVEDPQLRDL